MASFAAVIAPIDLQIMLFGLYDSCMAIRKFTKI